MTTRWLVTGAGGQLGSRVAARLAATGQDEVHAFTSAQLDVTDASAVAETIGSLRPDVVINAAAYTAVDAAETDEARASSVNASGPRLLSAALGGTGGRLLHVSTDYVFRGDADHPYLPEDEPDPATAYGRSKLSGERAVRAVLPDRSWVVRTAWVYGGPGANFVDTMRRLEAEREFVDVVDDQIGSPTWAGDLADAVVALGRSATPAGILHFVNAGQASWYELARETFRLLGADPARVRPVTSAEFVRPARRPQWSVLSTEAWTRSGLPAPRRWQEALAEAISSPTAEL